MPTLGEYLKEEKAFIEGLFVVYGTYASYPSIIAKHVAYELAKNLDTEMFAITFTESKDCFKKSLYESGIDPKNVKIKSFDTIISRSILETIYAFGEVTKEPFSDVFKLFVTTLLASSYRVIYTDIFYVLDWLINDITVLLSIVAKNHKKTVVVVVPNNIETFENLLQLCDVVIKTEHRIGGNTATYVIAIEKNPQRRYSMANYSITRDGIIIEEIRRYA